MYLFILSSNYLGTIRELFFGSLSGEKGWLTVWYVLSDKLVPPTHWISSSAPPPLAPVMDLIANVIKEADFEGDGTGNEDDFPSQAEQYSLDLYSIL